MLEAIDAYARALAARKGVGLFYFAGHGLQLQWRNYLLPVDARIAGAGDVAAQCVDMSGLLGGVRSAANPMNVIILDACRDNPFAGDVRAEQKGLSQMDAPTGTLLAYATAPGNTADDGDGANGLYTENLLREMRVREAKIEDVFKRVRLGVRRASGGRQIPWESTSLEEDFYFVPPEQLRKLSAEEEEREFREELAVFEKVKEAKDPAAAGAVPAPLPERALRGAGAAAARRGARRAGREARSRSSPAGGQSVHRRAREGRHGVQDRRSLHLSRHRPAGGGGFGRKGCFTST